MAPRAKRQPRIEPTFGESEAAACLTCDLSPQDRPSAPSGKSGPKSKSRKPAKSAKSGKSRKAKRSAPKKSSGTQRRKTKSTGGGKAQWRPLRRQTAQVQAQEQVSGDRRQSAVC